MTDTPDKPAQTTTPEIEFDLPESLKAEARPAPREVKRTPLARDMLDAAARAAALLPPTQRLLEQEEKRMAIMRGLTGSGIMDDVMAHALAQEDAMARAMAAVTVSPAFREIDSLRERAMEAQLFYDRLRVSSFHDQLLLDAHRTADLSRVMIGPIADMRASGVLGLIEDAKKAGAMFEALADYEKRFVLPDTRMISTLVDAATGLSRDLDLAALAAGMHSPWLDVAAQARSMAGFAELQTLGLTLRNLPPFEDLAAVGLRHALGDWRDTITWPSALDLEGRSAFYLKRGFRSELTDFPAAAFEESLDIAGLGDDENEAPDSQYADLLDGDVDASAFRRTNAAQYLWMLFEARLRRFIDTELTRQFGPDWAKHQLPNNMYDAWVEKREAAQKRGAPLRPIVAYADFTDYAPILTKKDHWVIFKVYFGTPESVRESFNRMHLPRIEIAHSRPISQDDDLYFRVEIKRLRRAFARPRDGSA
jgi:hypothetical protein